MGVMSNSFNFVPCHPGPCDGFVLPTQAYLAPHDFLSMQLELTRRQLGQLIGSTLQGPPSAWIDFYDLLVTELDMDIIAVKTSALSTAVLR